jgi:hypothetical protein
MRDLRSVEKSYSVLFPEAIHIWPGWTPQRRQLLGQAHSYLSQVEPLLGNNADERRELARAWFLVGNVEGDRHSPSLKDYASAQKSYQESERLLKSIVARDSSDDASQRLLQDVRMAARSAGD